MQCTNDEDAPEIGKKMETKMAVDCPERVCVLPAIRIVANGRQETCGQLYYYFSTFLIEGEILLQLLFQTGPPLVCELQVQFVPAISLI